MTVNQIFATSIATFVLITGAVGYWVYDLYEAIDKFDADTEQQIGVLRVSQAKYDKVEQLERQKSKLEVRRNEIEVAVPVEGSQSAIELMNKINNLKSRVETNTVTFPLLVTEQGSVTGTEVVVKKKKRGSRGAAVGEYKPVEIKISIHATWLGILRFIDLLENDEQIFNITAIGGGESDSNDQDKKKTVDELKKESPLSYPFYTTAKMTIETYHLLKKDVKVKK